MRAWFGDIYRTLFKIELAVMFQYRAAVVIWLIGLVLQPVIYLVVWLTVAETEGGRVGDFDAGSLSAYFLIMMVVNHATFSWHMWEMGYRVRSGSFNSLLVQPLHPFHPLQYASTLSACLSIHDQKRYYLQGLNKHHHLR